MVRIAGIEIPNKKRLEIALTYIHGIGKSSALKILSKSNISTNNYAENLKDNELIKLREFIQKNNNKIEGELRRQVSENIRRKIEIRCYQGIRHRKKLPVRGQRTKTNARTLKGPKRSISSNKSKRLKNKK